jgi:hypothetical protein
MFPIVPIVITLIIAGVALYVVGLIPMDGAIKQIIRVLVILFVCLWLLSLFVPLGAWSGGPYRR